RLAFCGSRIEKRDSILSRRQIVQVESRAVRRLPVLPKDAAIKFRLRNWRRSGRIQQKRLRDRSLPARQELLIVLDGAFDSGEVGSKARNGILLERRGISCGGQCEIPLHGSRDGGASRLVDLVAQLAILR